MPTWKAAAPNSLAHFIIETFSLRTHLSESAEFLLHIDIIVQSKIIEWKLDVEKAEPTNQSLCLYGTYEIWYKNQI